MCFDNDKILHTKGIFECSQEIYQTTKIINVHYKTL